MLFAEHDVLAVRLELSDHPLLCIVAHAPTAVETEAILLAWWERLGNPRLPIFWP